MKPLKPRFPILLLLVGMGLAPTAQAALIDRAFAVYDTVSNLSWLKDANYAQTSGYDADGRMTWADANTWAAGLTVGGYTGWRLPTALNADGSGPCGPAYNCTGSELGHLYYTVGGLTQGQTITSSVVLSNLFSNMQNAVYWSGTEYAPNPGDAWDFNTYLGFQDTDNKGFNGYAWAVRSGDVAAVSEPGVMGLLGIGALAWAGTRQKRRG